MRAIVTRNMKRLFATKRIRPFLFPRSFYYFFIVMLLLENSTANAAYLNSTTDKNTVYLLYSAPNQIARFDMATGQKLAPVVLNKSPSALAVKDGDAYIAYGRELYKINTETGEQVYVSGFSSGITSLALLHGKIYVFENASNFITIIDSATGLKIGDATTYYSSGQYAVSDVYNSVFYRDAGLSPSDLRKIEFSGDGKLSAVRDSPYHGAYPSASIVYLNGTQSKVYDNSGIAYYTDDLSFAGSLGGAVDAMTFIGDNAIVSRDKNLRIYASNNAPLGQRVLAEKPVLLTGWDQTVYAFNVSEKDFTFVPVDLKEFSLPKAGEPLDPNTLIFYPEYIESDEADKVFLVDADTQSVFVYSHEKKAYVASWRTHSRPTWATYSIAHKRLYLGFFDGQIQYFDAIYDAPNAEKYFVTLPGAVGGLLSAGNYIFAHDATGAWGTHYLFNSNGEKVDSKDWRNKGAQYVYNPILNRIYHYRDDTSPNDIEWADFNPQTGVWLNNGDSPYHGDTLKIRTPLRVSSSGEQLINGAGQILDTSTLKLLMALPNDIGDAVWVDQELITVNARGNALQFWNESFELVNSYSIPGASSIRILNQQGSLSVVSVINGRVNFRLFDLKKTHDSDNDGVNDLKDNCESQENADQNDFDKDYLGDVCDQDDDGDGISDEKEISLGLDPLNPEDATKDDDFDGFDNASEIELGSGHNDARSVPSVINLLKENFNTATLGEFKVSGWIWNPLGGVDTSGAMEVLARSGSKDFIEFVGNFDGQSILTFKSRVQGLFDFYANVTIQINDQPPILAGGATQWYLNSINIPKGFNRIRIGVHVAGEYVNNTKTLLFIDDLVIGRDQDGDQLIDVYDNCPKSYNSWQTDIDNDGLGDDCDPMPTQPTPKSDKDGDQILDVFDNCPMTNNPTQTDIDADNIGDACDPVDNRPKDSDADGVLDAADNCPLVANQNQLDKDRDLKGDLCDEDADGDGVLGQVEKQYPFMSDNDPLDVLLDTDKDGVDNGFELNHGSDPTQFNQFPINNLMDYFPLTEGNYVYADEFFYYSISQIHLPEFNEVVFQLPQGAIYRYSTTELGIVMTSFNGAAISGASFGYKFKENLQVPKSLKLGETISFNYKRYESGVAVEQTTEITVSIRLLDMGMQSFNGVLTPRITLERTEFYGGDRAFTDRQTYLKGIGFAHFDDVPLLNYAPKKAAVVPSPAPVDSTTSVKEPVREPTPKPENPVSVISAPIKEGGEPKPLDPTPALKEPAAEIGDVKPVAPAPTTKEPTAETPSGDTNTPPATKPVPTVTPDPVPPAKPPLVEGKPLPPAKPDVVTTPVTSGTNTSLSPTANSAQNKKGGSLDYWMLFGLLFFLASARYRRT
jgi:hypothetical protein